MKILADYDEQYLVQHVENPMLTLPEKSKRRWENAPVPEGTVEMSPCWEKKPAHNVGPWKMPPQMMRLIGILEEKFLGKWAYVKEYRETLREVDVGVKGTLLQKVFKLSLEDQKRILEMWNTANDEFHDMLSKKSPLDHEYGSPDVSFAPCPMYGGSASDTGPSAYALFRRSRTILVRAGVLRIRRTVKRHLGELLGRPLLDQEHIMMGAKRKLLQMQVETVLSHGAFGGMVVETNFLGNRRLALAVVEDMEMFKEFVEKHGDPDPRPKVRIITVKNGYFPDYVEEEA